MELKQSHSTVYICLFLLNILLLDLTRSTRLKPVKHRCILGLMLTLTAGPDSPASPGGPWKPCGPYRNDNM